MSANPSHPYHNPFTGNSGPLQSFTSTAIPLPPGTPGRPRPGEALMAPSALTTEQVEQLRTDWNKARFEQLCKVVMHLADRLAPEALRLAGSLAQEKLNSTNDREITVAKQLLDLIAHRGIVM